MPDEPFTIQIISQPLMDANEAPPAKPEASNGSRSKRQTSPFPILGAVTVHGPVTILEIAIGIGIGIESVHPGSGPFRSR